MKKYIRYIILFISFLLGIYFLNKWSNKEYEIEQNMLHNNFVLKGKVDSFKISNNHCFAILYISKFKSNSKEFNPKKEKKYFPYAIENNRAEVYDRIYTFILEANRENFGFVEDFVLSETVYLNEYKGAEYCGWHTDGFISDGPRYLHRKLTCVVQFTEPEEYTGGDFELFAYHQIKENIRPIGTAYIIPAFEWHQVTPILSGTRRSMIMFLEGKERFR